MIVLETAQAAKFAETITQAIDCEPQRPQAMHGLEDLPQHVRVMDADAAQIKAFIAEHCS